MSEAIERMQNANKDANKAMNKVREFSGVVNVFDILCNVLIILTCAFTAWYALDTGNMGSLFAVTIGCLIAYVVKVLVFGLTHTLVAIALNTEAE